MKSTESPSTHVQSTPSAHGVLMESVWTIFPWTAHGLYVDCRKYSHGLLMDCSWTAHSAHAVLMESMSTRCGLHTSAHGLHGNMWGSVKYSSQRLKSQKCRSFSGGVSEASVVLHA
jgi:hypothetical protein